jgi:hypothetical protein
MHVLFFLPRCTLYSSSQRLYPVIQKISGSSYGGWSMLSLLNLGSASDRQYPWGVGTRTRRSLSMVWNGNTNLPVPALGFNPILSTLHDYTVPSETRFLIDLQPFKLSAVEQARDSLHDVASEWQGNCQVCLICILFIFRLGGIIL